MGSSLFGAKWRWAVLLLAASLSSALLYQAGELYLAWHWERSSQVAQKLRAAQLIPTDAQTWRRLGNVTQFNFENPDPGRALGYYRKAVQLDPYSAKNWLDLAGAYEATGHLAQAQSAYESAERAYPLSASVTWQYGNFLLRHGEESEAIRKIHQAIVADPSLTPLAISRVWPSDPHADVLLDELLPKNSEALFQALDFLGARGDRDAALTAWKRIAQLSLSEPIRLERVFPFLDQLIAQNHAADADQVWREALLASRWPEARPPGNSLVWNGGFEAPMAGGGLGWRYAQVPGAFIRTDSSVFHSGKRSLRVDFTGGVNLDFGQVRQFIPVSPKTHYLFQAFLRTDQISTESGMRFELMDPKDPQVVVLTDALIGTNPWTAVRSQIMTGPETHFIDLILRRLPSRLFDNKLSGTVWVDDVTLVPTEGSPENSAP